MAVLTNSILVGVETNYMAVNWTRVEDIPREFIVLDWTFCVFFVLEFLLRLS